MNQSVLSRPCALVAALLCACLSVAASAAGANDLHATAVLRHDSTAQDKAKEKTPKVSEGEAKAAKAVEAAPDASAKLQAASDFLKKYPQSALRARVAAYVADQIAPVTDPAQKIALAENYLKIFDAAGEGDRVNALLLQTYIAANRLDDAFRLAASVLDKTPDPVGTLIDLTIVGTNQVKQQNPKYMAQSQQYGTKAIELIEADKKPAAVSDATWNEYKTKWLPQLYQLTGFIALVSGDDATAKITLNKAVALNPSDPFNYWLSGNLKNNSYQQLATQYKAASGAARDELLKKVQAQVDLIIDDYAHVVALTEGDPQYQPLRTQAMQDLQAYYKFRHSGSTDGLQQLIDKYKKASAIKSP